MTGVQTCAFRSSANDWLAQDLANILNIAVERPEMVETTALGAAMLAALGSGWFAGLDEAAAAMRGPVVGFVPGMDAQVRDTRLAVWREAVAKV